MATKTLGTAANNTLTAVGYTHVSDGAQSAVGSLLLPADLQSINNLIRTDTPTGIGATNEFSPGGQLATYFAASGQLYIPRRGMLKVLEGDWVGVDALGWPILVSAASAANAAWVHT